MDKCKNYIKARLEYDPSHILYLADCDEVCPISHLDKIYANAKAAMQEARSNVKFGVMIFNPEYEAFFLVSASNIDGCKECPLEIVNIEERRDAKHVFEKMIGHSYKETEHQKFYTKFVDEASIRQLRCGQHFFKLIDWVKNSNEQFYCDL